MSRSISNNNDPLSPNITLGNYFWYKSFTVLGYQVFLSNTNNLHWVERFQAFLCHINNGFKNGRRHERILWGLRKNNEKLNEQQSKENLPE